ncbi:MAG: 50S ribosomal protein L20 [bacterium]|nr:50S ribosomal protein L20 [bacterium]
MPRAKGGPKTRHRRKKWLKLAKGYRGKRSSCYRIARMQVMKSLMYAYQDRRKKKRTHRQLSILQINAAVRQQGIPYSKFIAALKVLNFQVNRKELAWLEQERPEVFAQLVDQVKSTVKTKQVVEV